MRIIYRLGSPPFKESAVRRKVLPLMRLCTLAFGFKESIRLWFLGSCVWPESYLQIFVNKDCHGLHNLALFWRTVRLLLGIPFL